MPSSVIAFFHYHPAARELDVTFVSRRRYRYLDVPAEVAEAMRASPSRGEFFNAHIRDRYRFIREPDSGRA
jgi:hypothetical protein